MLSEFNSFERVKRRELKYSVNGVCFGQIVHNSSNRISRSPLKHHPIVNYNATTINEIILKLRETTLGVF